MEDFGIFNRSAMLIGENAQKAIGEISVILFGVGGVGSWCAEALVRSGVRRLTIVDSDRVCESNVNRQLMATSRTIGEVKVDALKERLLQINPDAEITILIATGCHRGTTKAELIEKFGEKIVEKETIIIHDCAAEEEMVTIGTLPSGGALRINRIAAEADLLISDTSSQDSPAAERVCCRALPPGKRYTGTTMPNSLQVPMPAPESWKVIPSTGI